MNTIESLAIIWINHLTNRKTMQSHEFKHVLTLFCVECWWWNRKMVLILPLSQPTKSHSEKIVHRLGSMKSHCEMMCVLRVIKLILTWSSLPLVFNWHSFNDSFGVGFLFVVVAFVRSSRVLQMNLFININFIVDQIGKQQIARNALRTDARKWTTIVDA